MARTARPSPPLPPLPDDLGKRLEDALTIGLGFGVLAFQRAQVRRRELQRQLEVVWRDLQGNASPGGQRPPAPE